MKRLVGTGLAALFTLLALALNLRLYGQPDTSPKEHLAFLKSALQQGEAERMQGLFPEGYFFCYVLYGASWIDLAVADPSFSEKALKEARWALSHLESEAGREAFPVDQEPPHGVFYCGWTNWLRGGILKLEKEGPEKGQFQADCRALAEQFRRRGPYLEAYPGQAWPCDSTVAMAALALHDHLYQPSFSSLRAKWLDQAEPLLDHQVTPSRQSARGTSQVIIGRFLFEVDPYLAARHYKTFRRNYVTTRLGLPGVREYPLGSDGPGDVDSGPLVLGLSFSATGVMPGMARLQGDKALLNPLEQTIDTFGFPVAGRYLGGALPAADALLIWSRTAVSWTGQPTPETSYPSVVGWGWRWPFHLFWFILVSLVWLPLVVSVNREAGLALQEIRPRDPV